MEKPQNFETVMPYNLFEKSDEPFCASLGLPLRRSVPSLGTPGWPGVALGPLLSCSWGALASLGAPLSFLERYWVVLGSFWPVLPAILAALRCTLAFLGSLLELLARFVFNRSVCCGRPGFSWELLGPCIGCIGLTGLI